MSFSPNIFLSNIKNKDGLARPNRYEVILPIPRYVNSFIEQSILERLLSFPVTVFSSGQDALTSTLGNNPRDENSKSSNPSITRYLALQCETAELPGKTLQTADVKIYGPTFKVPYQAQFGDITLSFLCTNEFYERKLFERWIECIMPMDTHNLRFAKDEETRYLTNIRILQYDDFIKRIFAVELIDAFPIGIANQSLSWADDGFHRLSVQFAYQKYRVVYDGGYDLAQAASAIFGSAAARLFDKTGRSISDSIGRVIF
jgi:hypothetical protein